MLVVGHRNRAAVDAALSTYEDAMSMMLGWRQSRECGTVRDELEKRGYTPRSVAIASDVARVRDDVRHFDGLRFVHGVACRHVETIASALEHFGHHDAAWDVSHELPDDADFGANDIFTAFWQSLIGGVVFVVLATLLGAPDQWIGIGFGAVWFACVATWLFRRVWR